MIKKIENRNLHAQLNPYSHNHPNYQQGGIWFNDRTQPNIYIDMDDYKVFFEKYLRPKGEKNDKP